MLDGLRSAFERWRVRRRWRSLRGLGMHIGQGVNLPASTWIDVSHCFLISIGDWCGFGEGCMLLAHDAQFDEFLNAGRIGRVIIHPHSHIGARSGWCRSTASSVKDHSIQSPASPCSQATRKRSSQASIAACRIGFATRAVVMR